MSTPKSPRPVAGKSQATARAEEIRKAQLPLVTITCTCSSPYRCGVHDGMWP